VPVPALVGWRRPSAGVLQRARAGDTWLRQRERREFRGTGELDGGAAPAGPAAFDGRRNDVS
jgi:hypothetical protein